MVVVVKEWINSQCLPCRVNHTLHKAWHWRAGILLHISSLAAETPSRSGSDEAQYFCCGGQSCYLVQLCAEFGSLHHLVSDALTNECVATPCCLLLIGECVTNKRDGELCGGRIARMLTTSHMSSEITEWEDQKLRGGEAAGGLRGGQDNCRQTHNPTSTRLS